MTTPTPKNPIHHALDFLLEQQAISNPETAEEAEAHAAAISEQFPKDEEPATK
jgi:hypothetical protein